jgi:hypothetical protein
VEYKVVILDDMAAVQSECNRLGERDWKLVTAFPETFQECCNQQAKRKVVLIFSRPLKG